MLQLIGDTPPEGITKVTTEEGVAYEFSSLAVMGQLAVVHVPNPFFRHFSLIFHIKPSSPAASVLFAITDGSQGIMYIGVKLGPVQSGSQKLHFFYTEPDSGSSYEAASFDVPPLVNTESHFALSVYEDAVSFFMDCEEVPQVVKFERSPDPMELDKAAGIFVGQAGGADPDKFEVTPEFDN